MAMRGSAGADDSSLSNDDGMAQHIGQQWRSGLRAIAFYLPQFHPIPENDRWWGEGFTEWHNVAGARPRFRGHYQPHRPGRLGFYDLRLAETRRAQTVLAGKFGISAFCYYDYWFNGHRLLHRPLDEVVRSGEPDFPFCLCWANENWTRRWDGRDEQVLIQQDYASYQPERHIEYLATSFTDRRYVRVKGDPLWLIYNPDAIPELPAVISRWRRAAAANGLPGLHLCAVRSVHNNLTVPQMIAAGFDSVVNFVPHPAYRGGRRPWNRVTGLPARIHNRLVRRSVLNGRWPLAPVTNVFDYRRLMVNAIAACGSSETVHPCVMPSWDNSPRKRVDADVYQNLDPDRYGRWLQAAALSRAPAPKDQRLVFINAWNEWAEGCHLEPDQRFGTDFLKATWQALKAADAALCEGRAPVLGLGYAKATQVLP